MRATVLRWSGAGAISMEAESLPVDPRLTVAANKSKKINCWVRGVGEHPDLRESEGRRLGRPFLFGLAVTVPGRPLLENLVKCLQMGKFAEVIEGKGEETLR